MSSMLFSGREQIIRDLGLRRIILICIVIYMCSWHFSSYSVPIHWPVHCHMTSNNETVSRQMPWVGNIAKTMTSNRKQFTVTREMLTAVARHLSITWLFVFHRFDPFALPYNKSLNDWSLGEQWILFPSKLNVSLDFVSETKFTVLLGSSHEVFIVWCHFLEISMISVAGFKLHRILRPEISDETQLITRSPQKLRNQLSPLMSQVHLPQISCCTAVNQNINIRSFARIWWNYVPVNSKTAHPSPPPPPGAFDLFEKFWSNSPSCCQAPIRASKRVKSPTLQACLSWNKRI